MKRVTFFSLFLLTHVGFIFLHIHKHMQFIKQSFRKQKHERLLAQLEQEKQALINKLYLVQNRSDIQRFAQDDLNMKSIRLSQMKRVEHS